MAELPELIKDLALILVVAGSVTLLFKKLRQPLVLGYIVAGFLVSPQMPYTMSVVDRADVQTWADIGVVFLLFSLGLDFSFKKILKMGAAPAIAACTIIFCMMASGISVGKLFGWSQPDCVFLGGMLAMSSTTIIYKAFDDMGLRQQRFAGLVMSVLILEDILAIVMMVMLSAVASGTNPDGGQMLNSILRIGFFLILWFVVGISLIPFLLRRARSIINDETLLIVSLGLCCLMAVISTQVGFSSAFGAFVMGSILAETIEAERIIKIVEPVKNLFGAIFFVSVGMLVEPKVLAEYAFPIIMLVLTILIGQAVFGSFGYLISGQSLKTAMKCGFSMAQIGEFAFIIASLGLSLGVISKFLYPVVVAVSVITTFLTPYMIRFSNPCYRVMEKHLPHKIITVLNKITLSHPSTASAKNKWKSLITQMSVNTVIYFILSVAVIFIMLTFFLPFIRHLLTGWHWTANFICGLITVIGISPFLRAMVMKKNHSEEFKELWAESRLNHFPLIFTIIVRMVIACSLIFYVFNYLSRFANALIYTFAVAIIIVMILSRSIKHSSIRLERLFIQNLRSRDIQAQVHGHRRPLYEGHLLDRDIHMADVEVPAGSTWAGMRLRELKLRNRFGIHVSCILRANRRINIPSGEDVVFPGDKLQVIGSDEQLSSLASALKTEIYSDDSDIENREMKLHQMVITGNSPFVDKTLSESGIRDIYNCMVVGLEEGKENLSQIDPSYRFRKGDIIWVVGENNSVIQLSKA
ncbi:cation:proton antiporter [Xylanibacter muris]|uniref:Sodium:proton antiporter n=1 Tax=Xylanibacter muris TaxID=2736290 RepID=A0ABX2ASF1_9BACT|nr:cation:proton antiporter [Xylanibacter muris]NPD92962.1 sodium:proton antiporter [Xylanibacter muris]